MHTLTELKELLSARLGKKRYTHSLNVADESKKLAKKWGYDADKAYLAGLLHDVCKEAPKAEQKSMVLKSEMNVSDTEICTEALWHAVAGAWYLQHILVMTDMNLLNAVRYHTIGREGMSLLEKIVYVADLISADRTYKDVAKVRKLAYSDLDKAVLEGLRFSIFSVTEKGGYLPLDTVKAYNYYLHSLQTR